MSKSTQLDKETKMVQLCKKVMQIVFLGSILMPVFLFSGCAGKSINPSQVIEKEKTEETKNDNNEMIATNSQLMTEISENEETIVVEEVDIEETPDVELEESNDSFYNKIASKQIGDSIEFGVYEQDNNFESEDTIEWIVVACEGDNLLLLSKKVLEYKPFYENYNDASTYSWKDSDLRKFLNESFYVMAFSDEEKAHIRTVENYCNCEYYYDKSFLLSEKEMEMILNERKLTEKDFLEGKATRWTYEMGLNIDGYECSPYFSRTVYFGESVYANYYEDGKEQVEFVNPHTSLGIRPAIWVSATNYSEDQYFNSPLPESDKLVDKQGELNVGDVVEIGRFKNQKHLMWRVLKKVDDEYLMIVDTKIDYHKASNKLLFKEALTTDMLGITFESEVCVETKKLYDLLEHKVDKYSNQDEYSLFLFTEGIAQEYGVYSEDCVWMDDNRTYSLQHTEFYVMPCIWIKGIK